LVLEKIAAAMPTQDTKKCKQCHKEKRVTAFWKAGSKRDGMCAACRNERRAVAPRRVVDEAVIAKRKEYQRQYREKNGPLRHAKKEADRKHQPLVDLWRILSRRKNRLNITKEEFLGLYIPTRCPVLDIPIGFDLPRDQWPSVDRVNPHLPYQLGNIVIMSLRANLVKGAGNAEEHLRVGQWLRNYPMFAGKPIYATQPIGVAPSL
jgi:hypothetical protein